MTDSTPTCAACGTKFPGKETCKHCGLPIDASRRAIEQVRVANRIAKATSHVANTKGKKVPAIVVRGRAGATRRRRHKHGR